MAVPLATQLPEAAGPGREDADQYSEWRAKKCPEDPASQSYAGEPRAGEAAPSLSDSVETEAQPDPGTARWVSGRVTGPRPPGVRGTPCSRPHPTPRTVASPPPVRGQRLPTRSAGSAAASDAPAGLLDPPGRPPAARQPRGRRCHSQERPGQRPPPRPYLSPLRDPVRAHFPGTVEVDPPRPQLSVSTHPGQEAPRDLPPESGRSQPPAVRPRIPERWRVGPRRTAPPGSDVTSRRFPPPPPP
ncbi:hypothetical protein VULLAG_LOCUS458 [Vulpes lagopus]